MITLKLIVVYTCTVASSLALPQTSNNKKVGVSSLIEKFHQNDYKLEFERIELVRFNKQYMKKCDIVTFKYNRTSAVVNVTWIFLVDIDHDYDIVIQGYKFASNEYRLFPIRMQLNVCDAFQGNVVGLQRSITCGNFTGCSFVKNVPVTVCNWSPDSARFPPLLHNGNYMFEGQGLFRSAELYLARAYVTVSRPIV